MAFLVVDTNIVSYLLRGDSRGELYRPHLNASVPMLSFMTVGELYEGAHRRRWGPERFRKLETTVAAYVIAPATDMVAKLWGRVRGVDRRKQPIAFKDAWIAATALGYECPLLTHNPSDFDDIDGLQVITELHPG